MGNHRWREVVLKHLFKKMAFDKAEDIMLKNKTKHFKGSI